MPHRILSLTSLCSMALVLGLQYDAWCLPDKNKNVAVDFSPPHSIADAPQIDFRSRIASPWANAQRTHILEAHREDITLLSFSPNGDLLASVEPSTIALWDVETGELLRTLPGHYGAELKMAIAPTAIAFSPDGRYLATATWSQGLLKPEKAILVWDIETGAEVIGFPGEGCRQVLFSPDGKKLFGACGVGVKVWDFSTGEQIYELDTKSPIEAIALNQEGDILATANGNTEKELEATNHQIQLWELTEDQGKLLNTLSGHCNDIAQLAFTANGNRLVSSSYDGKIKVWNWSQGQEYPYLSLNSKLGLFSLNGNSRLIAGSFPSSLMTDLFTGLPVTTNIPAQPKRPSTVALSPDAAVFAWAGKTADSANPVILLWQPKASAKSPMATYSPARDDYEALAIKEYWGKHENSNNSEIVELAANPALAVGNNPETIALEALGLKEIVTSEQEEIELDYPQDNQAVVIITQTRLADDSVAAIRYRVELAPYGNDADEQWQVVWAGRQWQCQQNRGHQDWSTELCR